MRIAVTSQNRGLFKRCFELEQCPMFTTRNILSQSFYSKIGYAGKGSNSWVEYVDIGTDCELFNPIQVFRWEFLGLALHWLQITLHHRWDKGPYNSKGKRKINFIEAMS